MKVCVIGAGPSGLTTIKQLLDEGHEVTCFEKNNSVGGIWYRTSNDADEMKVFDSLILTISSKLMAFSDFMPGRERIFYTHSKYLQYLVAYADKFRLKEHVSFNTTVQQVEKLSDEKWSVSVSRNGRSEKINFDAVAVCSGPFQTPNMSVTDLDKFTGEVVHSSRYRNNTRFQGKRVMVVGLAESGADLLREVSDVADQCTLLLRSYSFLLPRLFNGTHSTDSTTFRAHHYEMWVRATKTRYPMRALFGDNGWSRALFWVFSNIYGLGNLIVDGVSSLTRKISRLIRKEGPQSPSPEMKNNLGEPMYPLKVDVGAEWTEDHLHAIDEWNRKSHNYQGNWSQKIIFSKNVSFIPNLVKGKITINDSGISRIRGQTVEFIDGTSKEFDAIVLCTGFSKNFSALGNDLAVKDNNVRNLYKHSVHPAHGGRLAFMGFVRPFSGGIPICAEMQARYFAQLCSGKIKLPENVGELIQKEKAWEDYWTSLSPRHTESIPSQILFLDSIAKEIGCLMPVSSLILNPRLFVRHWFYPMNQSCYRLIGPHNHYESALQQMMDEDPTPFSALTMLGMMSLSYLPGFLHPKNTTMNLHGQAKPLKSQSDQ